METKDKIRNSLKDKEIFEEPKDYICIIINDNYTTFKCVSNILEQVFHKTPEEANFITNQVHKEGKGIAGRYILDIAETKCMQAIMMAQSEGFPLRMIIEEMN
jgi:ATP-dependent Clp protease adaptor protein ClpS